MIKQNLFSKIMFLITSFIFVFFIFDTWELSFKDYQSLQSQLETRQEHANDLRNEINYIPVSYTHLRAHETDSYLVCRLLLEKKK